MIDRTLIPHLFRTEYRKIVSVLYKHFGFEQVEIAEDIASETFLTAAQSWGVEGVPAHPTAWLYSVAKNKARNYLQRDNIFKSKITPGLQANPDESYQQEIDLSPQNINDSQLQMMFAICHPSISPEAQIGLALRILCGFGIDEIADAFLTNKETINKRLFRAKEKLRTEKIRIELPAPEQMEERMENVLTTIYLLFNEGYYSVSQHKTIRKDLCMEAINLCYMLVENEQTNQPQVNALMSLMCFHASRLDARMDEKGELVIYLDQDASLWNADLVSKGGYFLHRAARGKRLSRYHLEAGIAYWHTQKNDSKEKWESILHYYNQLLQFEYSAVAALNRTYALSKVKGKVAAIEEAQKLGLADNHFYYVLLGELYSGIDDEIAIENFHKAYVLARTQNEKKVITIKLEKLKSPDETNC